MFVLEPDLGEMQAEAGAPSGAHGVDPVAALGLLASMGGSVGRVLLVGCEPAVTTEGMGLSARVAGAVDRACEVVRELVAGDLDPNGEAAGRSARGGGP